MECINLTYQPQESALGIYGKNPEKYWENPSVNKKSTLNYYPFGMLQPGRVFENSSYYYGFSGYERDDEIKGSGNSYDMGERLYDPRIGRPPTIDPMFSKFPSHSAYSYAFNNPIYFIDENGEEPREGNQVLKVDFDRAFITLIRDDALKFGSTDPNLRSSAGDRFAHVTLIGPRMRGPQIQKDLFKFKRYYDILEGSAFSKQNRAFAWIVASKSKTGYQYVEFKVQGDKLLDIRRDIVNLNEQLGVEGFENVVRHKQTFEVDKEGNRQLVSEEYWSYRSVESETGEKQVEYEHIKIDMRPNGKIERSGWQEAEPSKYEPDEE